MKDFSEMTHVAQATWAGAGFLHFVIVIDEKHLILIHGEIVTGEILWSNYPAILVHSQDVASKSLVTLLE